MERAIAEFLSAAGLDLSGADFKDTPALVRQAWVEEFLAGYRVDPSDVLSDTFPVDRASKNQMIVVSQLEFHSMCPHHLLPYSGRATVAYIPHKKLVGFGRIPAMLNVWARRLILQEALADGVTQTMMEALGARGAACVLTAEQACMRVRGGAQHAAVAETVSYRGVFETDASLRSELWARIGKAP